MRDEAGPEMAPAVSSAEEHYLTPKQLAYKLQTSATTIRRMLQRGAIPAVMVGSQVRFDWREVQRALRKAPAPEAMAYRAAGPIVDVVSLDKRRIRDANRRERLVEARRTR